MKNAIRYNNAKKRNRKKRKAKEEKVVSRMTRKPIETLGYHESNKKNL